MSKLWGHDAEPCAVNRALVSIMPWAQHKCCGAPSWERSMP